MSYVSGRTQIIIPKTLREEIEKHRAQVGETLAEYLRRSAAERIAREKKKKIDLKKLAAEVLGIARGSKTDQEIEAWEKEIRDDRRLSDQRLERRWAAARRNHVSPRH